MPALTRGRCLPLCLRPLPPVSESRPIPPATIPVYLSYRAYVRCDLLLPLHGPPLPSSLLASCSFLEHCRPPAPDGSGAGNQGGRCVTSGGAYDHDGVPHLPPPLTRLSTPWRRSADLLIRPSAPRSAPASSRHRTPRTLRDRDSGCRRCTGNRSGESLERVLAEGGRGSECNDHVLRDARCR